MQRFEQDLMDLISKHQELGMDYDELISVLELRIDALREEEEKQKSEE